MRIFIPQYIQDAMDEIKPYLEQDENNELRVKDDAPYHIKDAHMALKRWWDWHDEVLMFGDCSPHGEKQGH